MSIQKNSSTFFMTHVALLLISACLILIGRRSEAQLTENFRSHTEYLSSDELKGRGTGSKEIEIAANYISDQFHDIGLKPISNESYFQSFEIDGRKISGSNVIGFLQADTKTDRSIVFTAHYDAYGIIKKKGSEDSIYNGALDNAVGVAALIEIARLFSKEINPCQNIVFIATAAEEIGAIGSKYYVQNPIFPNDQISICLNIDGFNVSGLREDYFVMPRQGIDFLTEIQQVAKSLDWFYAPPGWVDSMNKKFDTASFLARGIPAVTIWTGNRLKGGGEAPQPKFGGIHSPEDEINEYWNWDGVEDHINLYMAVANYFLDKPDRASVVNAELFMDE